MSCTLRMVITWVQGLAWWSILVTLNSTTHQPTRITKTKAVFTFYHQKTNSKFLSLVSDSSSGVFQLSSWDGGKAISVKENALQQLMDLSHRNDSSIWSEYYNQIITLVLEALDDLEATIRELAASVMLEMLKDRKEKLDKDTEVSLETFTVN